MSGTLYNELLSSPWYLFYSLTLDTSILEQTTNLKKFLLQLQDAVPIVRLQIHLSIVPAPLFSWNVSFKNAHFVRKEENTLFSYLRIPPESSMPSIFQQENICRWTPREISSFDPKFWIKPCTWHQPELNCHLLSTQRKILICPKTQDIDLNYKKVKDDFIAKPKSQSQSLKAKFQIPPLRSVMFVITVRWSSNWSGLR